MRWDMWWRSCLRSCSVALAPPPSARGRSRGRAVSEGYACVASMGAHTKTHTQICTAHAHAHAEQGPARGQRGAFWCVAPVLHRTGERWGTGLARGTHEGALPLSCTSLAGQRPTEVQSVLLIHMEHSGVYISTFCW